MEHPGEASTPFQGCILFGTVSGTIGKSSLALRVLGLARSRVILSQSSVTWKRRTSLQRKQIFFPLNRPLVQLGLPI